MNVQRSRSQLRVFVDAFMPIVYTDTIENAVQSGKISKTLPKRISVKRENAEAFENAAFSIVSVWMMGENA